MSTQENSIVTNSVLAGGGANPSLVEVTSQLSPDTRPAVAPKPPVKPQVVFVDQERQTQIIEIHVKPKPAPKQHVPLAPVIPPVNVEAVVTEESERRFAVDPFVYEIDGPIPVMPTLPIIESRTSTDQVVAREQSGEHFACRLMPRPYPTEGNVSHVPVDETADPAPADPALPQPHPAAAQGWTETEVVAETENCDHGDCFFAQSGDVIAIDGNKGFDHIDLRSYSIDDATFQPGAILLHANPGTSEASEGEQLHEPITIRHRGIEFAVFSGEVRVEL